jgi:hypothetical protein
MLKIASELSEGIVGPIILTAVLGFLAFQGISVLSENDQL